MTMDAQLHLFRPIPTDQDVGHLIELLERRGWTTAAEIERMTGWTERRIRGLAAAGAPHIISGQRGYKHIARATTAEIAHAADWYRSQAREMLRRSIAIRRHAHQLAG